MRWKCPYLLGFCDCAADWAPRRNDVSATQCAFCDYLNPVGAKNCKKCNAPFHLAPCPFCTAVNNIAATSCYKCHAGLEPHSVRIFDSLDHDDQDQKTLPDIVAHTRTSASARTARVEPAMQSFSGPTAKRDENTVAGSTVTRASIAVEQPVTAAMPLVARSEPQLKTSRGPAVGVALAALAVVAGIAFFALRGSPAKEAATAAKETAGAKAATAASTPAAVPTPPTVRPIVTAPENSPAPKAVTAPTSAPTSAAVAPTAATPTASSAAAAPVATVPAKGAPPTQSTPPPAPPVATALVTQTAPVKAVSKSHTQRRVAARAATSPATQSSAPIVAPLRLPPPPPCTEAVAALGLCPK